MKMVHVECLPDEVLVKKLGFTRKSITHHTGKSRVFAQLNKTSDQLGLIDEDPGTAKTTYEQHLTVVAEANGVKQLSDSNGNKIYILKGKLEDWIIEQCKVSGISPRNYGLPEAPNQLHDVINQRLNKFEELLNELIDKKNTGMLLLKKWLQ